MQGPDPTATADELLSRYLHDRAAEFLRGLRSYPTGEEEAARILRRSSRRISGTLHTFQALFDPAWADRLRSELAWLSGTLGREHAYRARRDRLLEALARLSGSRSALPVPWTGVLPVDVHRVDASGAKTPRVDALREDTTRPTHAVGAARAGALLERQLTLPDPCPLGDAAGAGLLRFHAVADTVALLASEVPFVPAAAGYARQTLPPASESAGRKLAEAVAALPLHRALHPYNAEGLSDALDAPWHQVRPLLRLHRYAQEVLHADDGSRSALSPKLFGAGQALDHHREAAEAAAAAAAAARTPGSHRRRRTRWECCTPTSASGWKRLGTPSSRTGSGQR